ncbi:MAG: hypothetical protein GXP28_03920 [Planctomycetes bacterium]|nr:hypothetical protein [Planctomycetota bacterium]
MIEITQAMQHRIEAHVTTGLFKEPNEVLQAALDMLEHRQSEYDQLDSAIEKFERGEYDVLDVEDIKRRGRERRN